MKLLHPEHPEQYVQRTSHISKKGAALPFQPLLWGYSADRAFSIKINYENFILFYVLDGVAHYTKQKDSQFVSRNNVIISNCNVKMTFTRATPEWKYFYVVFNGTHAKLYYNMIRQARDVIPVPLPLHDISSGFTNLCMLPEVDNNYMAMQACFFLHQILHEIMRITQDIREARQITPVQQTVVNRALKYIDEHYKEELTVDSICEHVSFSKFYFCKLFKEQTGRTLYQYLISYRINKSKEYLMYSKLSIHAVALEVGFKNTLTYSRSFKQYENMTPSEYRDSF